LQVVSGEEEELWVHFHFPSRQWKMLEMRIVVEATGAGATFLLSPVWI
jgi:hypothetical protein